jgi:hypothetical protein
VPSSNPGQPMNAAIIGQKYQSKVMSISDTG